MRSAIRGYAQGHSTRRAGNARVRLRIIPENGLHDATACTGTSDPTRRECAGQPKKTSQRIGSAILGHAQGLPMPRSGNARVRLRIIPENGLHDATACTGTSDPTRRECAGQPKKTSQRIGSAILGHAQGLPMPRSGNARVRRLEACFHNAILH
jgi:hypothetical protein